MYFHKVYRGSFQGVNFTLIHSYNKFATCVSHSIILKFFQLNKISVNPDFYFEYDLRILTKNCHLERSASVVKDKQKLSDSSLW
jgi:hypothetical protein